MTDNPSGHQRYPEIDGCRGIAILMMVVYHLIFDLSFFSFYQVDLQSGFWRYFGYGTATLFVLIAGVAVAVRYGRSPECDSFSRSASPFIIRGFFLLAIGVGITLGTYIFLQGNGYVIFGILHLIGASTILAPFFFRFNTRVVVPGILLIFAGLFISLPYGTIWLVWAGIHPPGFYSVDYTPLIPWFGVFLFGMAAGFQLYPGGVRSFGITHRLEHFFSLPALPGRHSLIIYLVHQPVLVALLIIFFGKIPGW